MLLMFGACHMKAHHKSAVLSLVSFCVFMISLDFLSFEYEQWTAKLTCLEKCEVLGVDNCFYQRPKQNESSFCSGTVNDDVVALVLK